jgi:hypothetical protein
MDSFAVAFVLLSANEAPKPHDVIIRWHKSYDAMYLKNKAFDTLIENENPGPMLPACSVKCFALI